jgi:hypothetical protein
LGGHFRLSAVVLASVILPSLRAAASIRAAGGIINHLFVEFAQQSTN